MQLNGLSLNRSNKKTVIGDENPRLNTSIWHLSHAIVGYRSLNEFDLEIGFELMNVSTNCIFRIQFTLPQTKNTKHFIRKLNWIRNAIDPSIHQQINSLFITILIYFSIIIVRYIRIFLFHSIKILQKILFNECKHWWNGHWFLWNYI